MRGDQVRLRRPLVTPDYARSLRQHGMTDLDADQLVRLRIAGFQPKRR